MNLADLFIAKKLAGGGGGGTGTDNYNDLSNKPQINSTALTGDKSAADLGLQSEIDSDNKISADYVDDTDATNKFVSAADKIAWSGKQDAIDADHKLDADLVDDTTSDNKFVTASDKTAWNAKQNAIDSSHKLSSDLVDDTGHTNKFVTTSEKQTWDGKQNAIDSDHKLSSSLVSFSSAEASALASGIDSSKVSQISTNQTNISSISETVNILKLSEFNNAFGMKISKSDTNPNTKVSYMFNAEGMTPAYMDFTGGSFNFGGFSSWKPVADNRPVGLNFNGSVAYELNHTDFSKKLDGTASDITDATKTINFMSEMPLMYVRRWEDENYNYIVFCEYQTNENYTADAFKNASGGIGSKLYLPMFKGSYVDGKLRSLAKQYWQNNADIQGTEAEWNAAAACGTGWQTWDWAKREYLSDLMTFITKSTDWKNKFGRGVTNRSTSNNNKFDGQPTGGYCSTPGDLTTWTADYHGQFYGVASTTSDKKHVTAFYVEDPYGNRWERTPGLELYNNVYRAKMSPPYALTDSASRETYNNLGISAPTEGWFKTASTGAYGSIPVAVGASETTGYCSYFYKNASGVKLALFGGSCSIGGSCGRCVFLYAPSSSYWHIGASPCFVSP